MQPRKIKLEIEIKLRQGRQKTRLARSQAAISHVPPTWPALAHEICRTALQIMAGSGKNPIQHVID